MKDAIDLVVMALILSTIALLFVFGTVVLIICDVSHSC
jgi:hypothetical protein